MSGLLPGWKWVANARNGGGTYATDFYPYPWRIILHEIQGDDRESMIAGHFAPPHLWYDPVSREKRQTVPLDRSAFALYQAGSAPHFTNKARALQVELAGFTEYTADESDEMLRNIAIDVVVPLVQWVRSQGGNINLADTPAPPASLHGAASEFWSYRFTPQRWADFNGLGGHVWVPMGDDHWDPGAMDTPRIARYAAEALGGYNLASIGTQEMFTVAQFDEIMKVLQSIQKSLGDIATWDDQQFRFIEARADQRAGAEDKRDVDLERFDQQRFQHQEEAAERRHQEVLEVLKAAVQR
jgi:hypothetical protein